MRRLLALVTATTLLGLGLAAAAPPAQATPLALGGCMDTPVPLSESAHIERTCASWDGANLALWVEGEGLAQELTAVGAATFNLFGYVLTIEARAGLRHAAYGGWEGFVELTQPFAWGPLAVPLDVAEDGSRVTLWIPTDGLATSSHGNTTEAASSFTLTFAGADGIPKGTVAVPMGLAPGSMPVRPGPDVQPSTATSPQPAPAVADGPGAPAPSPTTAGGSVEASATTSSTAHAPTEDTSPSPGSARVSGDRARLGRY